MANSRNNTPTSWAGVVGILPAKLLTFAAIMALLTFGVLVAVTLIGYIRGDAITVAGLQFGKSALTIPSRAVVAYEGDKCPEHWTAYTKADGRAIVGAIKLEAQAASPIAYLTSADLRPGITGGTRVVNVSYPLPQSQAFTGFAVGAMADAEVTFASQGGALARYYILPPYLAMIFCIKD
jgi:hypothetical protein